MINTFFLTIKDRIDELKSYHLPVRLIHFGGYESKTIATLLYNNRDGMNLTFVVPLYFEMADRIRNYFEKKFPEANLDFISCPSSCSDEFRDNVCYTKLHEFYDLEHINVCPSTYDYTAISECLQCKHIIPNPHGFVRPRPDGNRGKVWNFFPYYNCTEKDIDRITNRKDIYLASAVCPACRSKFVEWWDNELTKEGF